MGQPAQTVIYRLDEAHDPMWQFHSMPESIVGGGNTLDRARSRYREALKFSLGVNQLPEIREYIEKEAGDTGIWIRTSLRSPVADNSFKQIARQLSQYPSEDLKWFYRHPSAGADPVVVSCGPDDTLGSIVGQMTPFDSLIVVMGRVDAGKIVGVAWVVIEGIEAKPEDERPVSLDEFGLTADSPMGDVFRFVMEHFGNKPTALLAPA